MSLLKDYGDGSITINEEELEINKNISLDEPAPKPDIVFGSNNIDEAKITGITPAVFIFKGK